MKTKLREIKEEMFGYVRHKNHEPYWKWYRLKFKVSRKYLEDGYRVPRRYGRSYYEFDIDATTYWIIPINLIVGFFRHLYFLVAWNLTTKFIDRQVGLVSQMGFKQGYISGYFDGWNKIKHKYSHRI